MCFRSYSMMDSGMFSKERGDETRHERESEDDSQYYYDDSTGYRTYNPENEDEDLEDEREEEE